MSRTPLIKYVVRHARHCRAPRWIFSGGHEIADEHANIKARTTAFLWFYVRCVNCKKAEALVRETALRFAVNMLEGR